ncbi:MAG: WG repeat-containing protein [Chloracidobacterium sp.]|nr:WG repeat-containing protein [Chloracidobacterium sp.]
MFEKFELVRFRNGLFLIAFSTIFLLGLIPAFAQAVDGDDLFVVIVDNKRGYIDRTGKIVIQPKWARANNFSEGLAVVASDEDGYKEGYIDTSGKVVVEPQYPMARDFSEGLAAVGFGEFGMHNSGSHKTGFIDKSGKLVIEAKYRDAGDFSEGLATVHENGKYGYIDRTGKLIVPITFDSAMPFSEGLANVRVKNKWGYIDRTGTFVIAPAFTWAGGFSEGLAAVKKGGNVITMDDSGESKNNDTPERWSYIDRTGKIKIKLSKKTENAAAFSEGLAAVGVKGEKDYTYNGYIDRLGNFVIEPQFSTAENFSAGLALVITNTNFGFQKNGFGFIDTSGRILLSFSYPSEYAMVNGFKNGLAWVQKGGEDVFKNFREAEYGYIDKTGKVIWKPTK